MQARRAYLPAVFLYKSVIEKNNHELWMTFTTIFQNCKIPHGVFDDGWRPIPIIGLTNRPIKGGDAWKLWEED
jgi:hypothetical protein